MGEIIRLECFIKTKNPEIQYKISLFSQLLQVIAWFRVQFGYNMHE